VVATVVVVLIVLVVQGALGATGGWISTQRGRGALPGFLLGFFLSAVGVLITSLLPRPIEHQVREAVAVEQAVDYYKRTGQLPPPTSRTNIFALPEAEWAEGGTPKYEQLLAQAGDEVSLHELLLASDPNELPKPTRKLLRVPLEVLPSHLDPKEQVERVAAATSGSIRGLLILTAKRLLFLDQVSGTIEAEIPRDDFTACLGAKGSVLVWSAERAARFMHVSPASLEPQVDSAIGAAGSSNTQLVPRLRVCSDCKGEFTPFLLLDTCPDCGGSLIPAD
jgi:hypothetical protein